LPHYHRGNKQSPVKRPDSSGNIVFLSIFNLDFDSKNFAKIGTDAVGVVDETNDMDLVGQTILCGMQMCLVKGRIKCRGAELYALESDKPMRSYNGRCPQCGNIHIVFDRPNRGYYTYVKVLYDKIYGDRLAAERS
jgi:ribosomal protein S27AE